MRLFRIREESMKEEFRGACDKPLTDEEAEQMWKEVREDIFDSRKNVNKN